MIPSLMLSTTVLKTEVTSSQMRLKSQRSYVRVSKTNDRKTMVSRTTRFRWKVMRSSHRIAFFAQVVKAVYDPLWIMQVSFLRADCISKQVVRFLVNLFYISEC